MLCTVTRKYNLMQFEKEKNKRKASESHLTKNFINKISAELQNPAAGDIAPGQAYTIRPRIGLLGAARLFCPSSCGECGCLDKSFLLYHHQFT